MRSAEVITLICSSSASASLVASSLIATGLKPCKGRGLNSPYRRIIFGLSLSDILQSFSLVTGPFAIPSSNPFSVWAVGNDTSCKANGFFYVVGSTGTPLYMFALCLYTAVKIKTNISDEAFTHKIGKPMHFLIIMISASVGIAGLATRSINASLLGTSCTFGAAPTGCRQRPDLFGECDPMILRSVDILINISSIAVPFFSLCGIICCMGIICWNILFFKKEPTRTMKQSVTLAGKGTIRGAANRPHRSHRLQKLRFETRSPPVISASQPSLCGQSNSIQINDIEENDKKKATITVTGLNDNNEMSPTTSPTSSPAESPTIMSPPDDTTCMSITNLKHENEHFVDPQNAGMHVMSPGNQDLVLGHDIASINHNKGEYFPYPEEDEISVYSNPPADTRIQDKLDQLQNRVEEQGLTHAGTAAESKKMIRVYRREIIIQAGCFVLAFLLTFVLYWSVQIILLKGKIPPKWLIRCSAAFFPFGGVFNMLAYARPKIVSFRLKHPGYSWFRAFWAVIKAGGDIPSSNGARGKPDHGISSLAFLPLRKKEVQAPSNLSGQGMYDGSRSFGKNDNIAYRSRHEWDHVPFNNLMDLGVISEIPHDDDSDFFSKKSTWSLNSRKERKLEDQDSKPVGKTDEEATTKRNYY